MPKVIDSFRNEYFFLSNFYNCPFVFQYKDECEPFVFLNAEAAFQSTKTLYLPSRKMFCQMNPSVAKSYGRSLKLREDWEYIKLDVMYEVVKAKFKNAGLGDLLLGTGDATLIEGNTWNDKFWGVCNGVGENNLGYILMKVREELRKQ